MTQDELRQRFIAELPRVIGALLDTSASRRNAASRPGDGFVVNVEGSGDARGVLQVYVGRRGAEMLAKVSAASALEPSDAVVLKCLKELCAQIVGGLGPDLPNVAFRVSNAAVAPEIPSADDGVVEVVVKGQEHVIVFTIAGDLATTAVTASASSNAGGNRTLDVIMDIDLPLVVRFGRTELPLKMLTSLGPGSVIDLGRAPDDPVEVLISNRVVARGEVVIVAGSYGVRVRDVVSPAERARSLEAELA